VGKCSPHALALGSLAALLVTGSGCSPSLADDDETDPSTGTHTMAFQLSRRHSQCTVGSDDHLEAIVCARGVDHDHEPSEQGLWNGLGLGVRSRSPTRRATSRTCLVSAARIGLAEAAVIGGAGIVAATKPYRRASEQFNIRATPEEAALIRAAFLPRTINKIAVELLVAEARTRLARQRDLDDAGERRTTEAA